MFADLWVCTMAHCTVITYTQTHAHFPAVCWLAAKKHEHARSEALTHTHPHTNTHTNSSSQAKHTQSSDQSWGVTKHHVLPSAACRLTPPPHLTSDRDDNRLSSPSLLLGKHSVLQKLADRQNGVPKLCVCVCLCVVYVHFYVSVHVCSVLFKHLVCFWFVLYPALIKLSCALVLATLPFK